MRHGLVLLAALLLCALGVHAQSDFCTTQISLSQESLNEYQVRVLVDHNDVGRLRVNWRGGQILYTPSGNPMPIDLDVTCLVEAEPVVITPSKCGIEGEAKSLSISPPNLEPVLDLQTTPPYHSQVEIYYWMPSANVRRIRAVFLPTGDVIRDTGVGGTNSRGDIAASISANGNGPVLVKAISCDVKTAVSVVAAGGQLTCGGDGKCCDPPMCIGNPVNVSSENMRYEDVDPLPGYALPRVYDTRTNAVGFFGARWFSPFDANLKTFDDFDGLRYVTVTAPDRSWMVFEGNAGVYRQVGPDGSRDASLVQLPDGSWRQTMPGRAEVRLFNTSGNLTAIRDVSTGRETRFVWSGTLPTRVEDSWGNWALDVTTDATARRITAIAPEGRPDLAWHYIQDTHLQRVDSPLGVWRTYEYAMAGAPYINWRMVVARDAAGNTIESHDYHNDSGRTRTSYGPGGEVDSIAFTGDGRVPREKLTTVVYRNGRTELRYLRVIASQWRTVEVSNGCASCGERDRSVVYDSYGNIVRAQAGDGYITTSVYDGIGLRKLSTTTAQRPASCDPATAADNCRLTTDDLATAVLTPTAATQITSYAYADTNWPDRVTSTTTASVLAPPQIRRETTTYHPTTGVALTRSVTGWTGIPAHQETRTTTTALYDGTEGAAFHPGGAFATAWLSLPQPMRAKTVDGPRSDITDATTFVYYPIDPAVPAGWRGQLAAVRNALGHVTRFENYDAFGNAQRVVDPNGVVTDTTHDALGRRTAMTLRGVTGCDTSADPLCATDVTATWSYAAAGPLATAQQPGGGATSYGYDARGRVASVSRGPSAADLRERIETTYDPDTGKKNAEVVFAREGGAWVEKRRLAYSYNTFEELGTVTYPGNASIGYQYDPAGRLSAQRDENHTSPNTRYGYDPGGRLHEVKQTLGSGFATTTYAYDFHGNLTAVTDPNGNITSYVYDDFGQLLSQQSPVSGTTPTNTTSPATSDG
jgi:YD repeat-containing protein